MRSLSSRLFAFLVFLLSVQPVLAHDVTLSGTQSFASLDGSSSDHDGSVNGVFTVNDGNLVVNGTVNCNDDGPGGNSACSMAFAVSGNMTVNSGGALYAENRSGSGNGGGITLTVGGNVSLNGTAIVSAASTSNGNSNGGSIAANVSGNVTLASGTTLDAGASNGQAGSITIASGGVIAVDGNVFSGPSRALLASRLTGAALNGGNGNQSGGAISMSSTTFVEPAIVVGATANIVSQGEKNATGPVTLDACGIEIRGLVAALSRKETAARVTIRSGKNVLVDGRDLGAAGTRQGILRADSTQEGATDNGVDIFASDSVQVLGPSAAGTLFAVTSVPAGKANKDGAGTIRVISLGAGVSASGRAFLAGVDGKATRGGLVSIAAFDDVNLDGATIVAVGDWSKPKKQSAGGTIQVRSHSGDLFWRNGTGDVRPVGSQADVPPAEQGKIILTACGTIDTTGSTYPTNGVPTGVFPQTQAGVCSPATPSLPIGVPPLVTCNTPPVANDATAATNEDTTVTITLSGSDADGDPLTFTIVSGPANGTLGPIISTGPNTATVNYSPNLNYNGSDGFVYRAHDGNGGTDDANVSITIAPVNDPPSFLIGPTAVALEDSGPQTYANWATSISPGPADESGQTVTFTVTNDNPTIFSVQPSVASNGTLTFTPALNQYGTANLTVTAQDNGGTALGGNDTSAPQSSSINVTPVNDEPSFVAGPSQTVNEDAGPQSVANWATSISAGPNETQNLTFVVSNDNSALFSSQPAVSPSGTLTYTPAADANGSATVTVYLQDDGGIANGGDDTSPSAMFTITVNSVNDAPSFTSGGNVTVDEDSGAYSAAWATAISAGPANESSQTVSFSVSNDNAGLFSVAPSISASGVLSFTIAANASGSANVTVTLSDNGGIANGGVDTSAAQTFVITVDAINDPPSFTPGPDVTSFEDDGPQTYAAWATSISAGPNESGQTLTFNVTNDNNALFSVQPAIAPNGDLTYTAASNANGSAIVTVVLQDNGGGTDSSAPIQFTITVVAVNDAPSFTSGGNVTVLEDSGAYSAAWATGISTGPADESGQSVAFNIVSNSNAGLFAVQPSIAPNGVLSFTPVANAFGSATITINLQDNGGIANGGSDTSANVTFTITVDAVNDAPSFVAGGNVSVAEDSGAYSAAWATGISAGPNESGQTVTFNVSNDNNGLFAVQPSISASGVLTFTPALNQYGSATVTVSLSDNGGIANGGVDTSAPVTFTITVTPINDPPTAGADSWDAIGNTEIRVDLGTGSTPAVYDTTTSGNGVLDNDADTAEGDPFAITSIVGCADTTAPFDCTFGSGAKLTMEADGSFTFTPAPGATTASFQYVVTDVPSAGTPASATGTVTFTLFDMVWYVDGTAAAGGNGTSREPFNALASISSLGDADGPGHYLFIHDSTLNGSVVLEQGQRLWGEGIGLILPHNLNGNGGPTVLVAPGNRPQIIGGAGNTVTVDGVSATEIAGLNVSSSGGGITVETMIGGPAAGTAIYSNVISGAGGAGINVTGRSIAGTTATIDTTSVSSNGNGLNVDGIAGPTSVSYTNGTITSLGGIGIRTDGQPGSTLRVTALANVNINGSTASHGISMAGTRFDANAATAAFETVSAPGIVIGVASNPVGASGMVLSNVSGDVAFGTVPVFASTSGVTIDGTGLFTGATGMRVTMAGGSISAPAGVGLRVANATIGAADINLTSINATGGVNGIALNNTGAVGGLIVSGTGAANSGGALANATGDGILLSSTSGLSLTDVTVTNSAQSHIDATNVDGLALTRVSTDNSVDHGMLGSTVRNLVISGGVFDRGGAGSVVPNKHGFLITNLLGSSSVTGAAFRRSNTIQFRVQNTTATTPFPGAPDTLTVSNTTWDTHTGPFAGDHLSVDSATGGNFRLTLNGTGGNNSFSTGGIAVQATGSGNGRIEANVSGALVNNTTAAVVVGTTGTSSGTYSIVGNKPANGTGFSNAGAVSVSVINTSTGSLSGTINDNAITNAPSGNGMQVILQGNGSGSATITNNVVSGNIANSGIRAQASNGNGFLSLNVHNNNVSITSPFSLDSISIEAGGSGVGHTNTICLNMSNNTSSSAVSGQQGYRLRQRAGTTFNLQNFVGSGASATDVSNWVNVTKTNVGTTDIVIATTFSAAPGTCP